MAVKEERVPSPAPSPSTPSVVSDRSSPLGAIPSASSGHADTTPVHLSVITSSPAKKPQSTASFLPQVETPSFGDSFAPLMAPSTSAATPSSVGLSSTATTVQTPTPPKKQHSATPLLKANYQAALQKSPPFMMSSGNLATSSTSTASSPSAVTSPSTAQTFAQVSAHVCSLEPYS